MDLQILQFSKAYTDYALDNGIITKTDYDRINVLVGPCELAIKLCGRQHGERSFLFCLCPVLIKSILFSLERFLLRC